MTPRRDLDLDFAVAGPGHPRVGSRWRKGPLPVKFLRGLWPPIPDCLPERMHVRCTSCFISRLNIRLVVVRPRLLADGGMETTMIFWEGLELPYFASFPLLETQSGQSHLIDYYEAYLKIARSRGLGFILSTPTWRASSEIGL